MLILTRRPGESLHLGDNIKVTVLGVQGKQIKILTGYCSAEHNRFLS